MTYRETLDDIFSRGRFGIKPGLERITALLARLDNPHEKLRIIQIAGTNGKGSTGAFLSAILTATGIRTAFFSSPHLVNFTERFRLDDQEIAEETLFPHMQRVMAVAPPEATFFEIVTAIGFLCFYEEGADIAIMEAGMGGKWDATNVSDSILSILTPISLDHCAYLGDTLEAIASEKAGIIKHGKPVVIAGQEPEALATLLDKAEKLVATPFVHGRDYFANWSSGKLIFSGVGGELSCRPALKGGFQAGNAAAAIAAARILRCYVVTDNDAFANSQTTPLPPGGGGSGWGGASREGEKVFCEGAISDAAIVKGVASAYWPGRMELFTGSPYILLDGAHNPAGIAALANSLADFSYRRLLVVIGVMADKSWQEMLEPLLPLASKVFAVAPALDRALGIEELASFCSSRNVESVVAGNVETGLEMARAAAFPDDLILVCGSLFTVGEARAILTGGVFMPIRG